MMPFEEDHKRRMLAMGFARFVMDIIKANIDKGGDERSLFFDLQLAAYETDMQWMPKQQFQQMQALKKFQIERLERTIPPIFKENP